MAKNDYSYEYTNKICSAIEQFTQEEERKNKTVFQYRDSNLKYALERAMYFRYVNDENLYNIFESYKKGGLKEVIVIDDIEKKLISTICNLSQKNIIVKNKSYSANLKNLTRVALRLFIITLQINRISRFLRNKKNKQILSKYIGQTCFCIEKEKFARYLDPLTSQIKNDFFFLTNDNNTHKYLKSKNVDSFTHWSKFYFLERWAKKKDILYKFVLTDKYDLLFDLIRLSKPKCAVVVEGNAPHDEIVNQICKKLGIESVCIQQGWSPIVHSGFRNMSYSKMLVWGEGFAELFKPYNPDQKFIITGSHNIRVDNPLPQMNKKEINLVFFIQWQGRLLSEDMNMMFVDLINWISKELPNIYIIVAGKGVLEIASYIQTGEKVEIINDPIKIPLQKIFDRADVIVSAFSSVILESVAIGKLPIIFNMTPIPNYSPDISKEGAAIEIKTLDDAKKVIQDLSLGKIKPADFYEPMKKCKNKFFAFNTEQAVQNIIKEITM